MIHKWNYCVYNVYNNTTVCPICLVHFYGEMIYKMDNTSWTPLYQKQYFKTDFLRFVLKDNTVLSLFVFVRFVRLVIRFIEPCKSCGLLIPVITETPFWVKRHVVFGRSFRDFGEEITL